MGRFASHVYRNAICYSYYNNGWFAYCADCGEKIEHMLIYGRESTVRQIKTMPASSIYVYLCPYCTHLEQGHHYQHLCKAISYNRYKVTYRPNVPEDTEVLGNMASTLHMYNDSPIYNGQPATEIGYTDKTLRQNSYRCEGYVFQGWNTKADGSGQAFTNEQAVKNLTSVNDGIVRLYAQWEEAESTLLLDAAGGTYHGEPVYEQTQKYGTVYHIDKELITPPVGYKVTFEPNGGEPVDPITTTKRFSGWKISPGFVGELRTDVYKYTGVDGTVDKLTAEYQNNAFILPNCTAHNRSLVGWYSSEKLTEESFVGKPGDKLTVEQDTVLYAKWAPLTLWAYDDYDSHEGVGALDLKWEQKDGKGKFYRLYQSEDNTNWKEVFSGSDIQNSANIVKEYGVEEQGTTYTIPYTGNYILTAYGAKGADYSADYVGGKGGSVTVTYWLNKGDILTVYPGKAGDGLTGGTNGNGADGGSSASELGRGGGAATQIYVTRNDIQTLLITAGGGGGANGYASGGDGGSTGGNGTSIKGADGVGAGGGGATGGLNGDLAYHVHTTEDCGYHEHDGSSSTEGNCYPTREILGYEEQIADGGYCNTCGDTTWQGSGYLSYHESRGHDVDWEERVVGTTTIYGDYIFDCPYDIPEDVTGYLCGMTEETVVSASVSFGGSNYVSSDFGAKNTILENGMNNGAGKVTLESLDVGYTELTHMDDVLAKDKAAPGKITKYKKTLIDEEKCRISVQKPDDYGTLYYHKAESYEEETIEKLSTSNITRNTLISGILGYWYYMDTNATGVATSERSWTDSGVVDAEITTIDRYLHIAAADVAGNIGSTTSIFIEASDIEEAYIKNVPPKTEQLLLEDTEYVYEADTNKYYVKADGETAHRLTATGYVDGTVTQEYQVDWLRVISSTPSLQEWYGVRIPKSDASFSDQTFLNEELETDASSDEMKYVNPISVKAARTNVAARVELKQQFTIDASKDGKQITVYPRAMAEFAENEYWSNLEEDTSHALMLIPDAIAPSIRGIEALEHAGNLDMTEESKEFVITATDTGSGLRGLTITITNLDNQKRHTYTSNTGKVTITVTKDDYLFLGDFVVVAEAVDNVGNRNVQESDKLAFTLQAELKRSRLPYDADFKAGDGAVLTVTTGGYADKVLIRFPAELLILNPTLNKEYVYEIPEAIKTEVYEFNIPLGTPGGSYTMEVEAWKNGRKLTEELQLPVRTAGSIIEEFRTRIRDNGV